MAVWLPWLFLGTGNEGTTADGQGILFERGLDQLAIARVPLDDAVEQRRHVKITGSCATTAAAAPASGKQLGGFETLAAGTLRVVRVMTVMTLVTIVALVAVVGHHGRRGILVVMIGGGG